VNIAEKLKTTRESKKISVYKLSQMSGVSETHIRDLERGDRNPSLYTLDKLAKPLGLSLSDLLKEDSEVSYLNSEETELVECFRMLSNDRAEALLRFLKTLTPTE